jgi:hypothetical protein
MESKLLKIENNIEKFENFNKSKIEKYMKKL